MSSKLLHTLGLAFLLCGLMFMAASLAAAYDKDQDLLPKAGQNDPWRVRAIHFKGFDNISLSAARNVLETKVASSLSFRKWPVYDRKQVARDEARLIKLYQEHGFFDATVEAIAHRDQRSKTMILTFDAHEGEPVKISRIEFIFPEPVDKAMWEKQLRKSLPIRAGENFNLSLYQKAKTRLARVLSDDAHPMHELDGQVRVYPKKREARVFFRVVPGPRVLFGRTSITGYKSISKKYIAREITYSLGEPFSLTALDNTQKALLDTGFFVSAELEPQYTKHSGDMVPVRLIVQEKKTHSIRFGLGYGTEDKIRVRILQINRDLFGLGDTLTFEGKISSIYEGLVGRWKVPYLLSSRTNFNLSGGQEQKDNEAYINRRLFVRPIFEYQASKRWTWHLGYNVENNRMREIKTQVPDPGYENQAFFIASVPFGVEYDSRDSALNPTRGTYFYLDVEVALSATASELEFVRPVANLSHTLPIPGRKGWYLAGRAKGGIAQPITSGKRIPLVRRFFAGGADSVRGYPYQKLGPLDDSGRPLGGEALFESNLELRFPLWKELGGVVFFDAGNVYESLDSDIFALRFTSGVGLRYNTPVGPLRVDVGYQLNPPSDSPLSRFEAYLSVGQAF